MYAAPKGVSTSMYLGRGRFLLRGSRRLCGFLLCQLHSAGRAWAHVSLGIIALCE